MAQTGIGTTSPNASAKLDVYSDNKSFLTTRVSIDSAKDVISIASPEEGLLVYNTGTSILLGSLSSGAYIVRVYSSNGKISYQFKMVKL